MTSRPLKNVGTLHRRNDEWSVALETGDPAFEEGMPVRLVLWDGRESGSRSEVERIAAMQQLETEIVALALSAEGALAGERDGK